MRVLFIYPNVGAQIGFNYGVAYISAVLKQAGHQTALLDINDKLGFGPDLERIRAESERFDPDIICFSLLTNQFRLACEIAAYLRRHFRDVPFLAGGIHATMAPEVTLETGLFDFLCVGEGEGASCELVDRLERGAETTRIRNIWYRDSDGTIHANPVRPFVSLDTLPIKDYEIFDFQRMINAKDGWVGLMTSRGHYCLMIIK